MVITMHLRIGSISEADKVILIFFFFHLTFSERKEWIQVYYVTSFALACIRFNEFTARQLESQIKILKLAFLQNKNHQYRLLVWFKSSIIFIA